MGYEDFTTYTEVDPNSHIGLVGTNHVDATVTKNEDAYLYKDKGEAHFGDFEHKIDFTLTPASTVQSMVGIWALTNDLDDINGLNSAYKTFLVVELHQTDATHQAIRLQEFYNGTGYSTYSVQPYDTWYYLTIKKTGTELTCKIYSDSARTNLLATLSLTLHGNWTFRYVFGTISDNTADPYQTDVDIENLNLQEVVLYIITGHTYDATGNLLSDCTVWLFKTSDKSFMDETVSDENGYYEFTVPDNVTEYFIRAHKDGTPNVFGTTHRDLKGQ